MATSLFGWLAAKKFLRALAQSAMSMSLAMKVTGKSFAFRNQSVRRIWALMVLVLFIALQVFAGSATLHKAIHADASSPSHHCVITLLAKGQVNAPPSLGALVAFTAALIFFLPLFQTAARPSFDYRLSPSRAPPRF